MDTPTDVFALLATPPPVAAAATRRIEVCGAPVELVHRPERAARQGAPSGDRPSFRPDPADRIVADEAVWSDADYAVTPNRFPFAARHALLWSRRPRREPHAAMLELAFRLAAPRGAAVLVNSVGAAASIARSHAHLVDDRTGFLAALATARWHDPLAEALTTAEPAVEIVRATAPFPALLLGIRGPGPARARTAAALLAARTVPAFNLVDQHGVTWILPRSAEEAVGPEFPQAFGAAELWGRWCFLDGDAYATADAERLTRALRRAGRPA